MNGLKIVALALIAAGVLGLMYGGFTYTKETHEAKIGPIEMAVKEKETGERPGLGGRWGHRGWRRAAALGGQKALGVCDPISA